MFALLSLLFVSLVSSECVDQPNWGCDGIDNPEDCNGLQMKKCLKACGMCTEEEESAEEPANECTETFDPICDFCQENCNDKKFVITTRGEGQMSKFGCSYPKNYEFVDQGVNCPVEEQEEKVSCDGLDCAGCLAVPDNGCGFADGACYTAGKEPMTATSFAFTTDDCPKEVSCDGLDCAGCLAVPDYGCGFADGACYTARKEPMTATSFAFTTDDCPKEEESKEEESKEEEECVDQPNWGCDGIDNPDHCNGLQMKKCLKACGVCGGAEESAEEPEPENECTETFEPVCVICEENCNDMTFVIETRGEGQMSKFGCSYPKNYEFVNAGDNCPEVPEPEECVDKVDELRGVLYDDEADCVTAMADYGASICSNKNFIPYCCATCANPPPTPTVELEECDCGLNAVEGEENFQSGSADGDKMCQFGNNCATFFEGCDGKGAKVCSLKIEYAEKEEELPTCTCGINAVEGEENFQSGSVDGDKMCQFSSNCATFFEGCDGKGATVCSLKIEYVKPASRESEETAEDPCETMCEGKCGLAFGTEKCGVKAMGSNGECTCYDGTTNMEASKESEESAEVESAEEEEEEVCDESNCLKPCKGRRKKRFCQVKENSKCSDIRTKGKGRRKKYFSKLACQSKSQTLIVNEPVETSWTSEEFIIQGFALVGLVALTRGVFVLGRQLKGERYQLVEEIDSEL